MMKNHGYYVEKSTFECLRDIMKCEYAHDVNFSLRGMNYSSRNDTFKV